MHNTEIHRCQRCGLASVDHVCSKVDEDAYRAEIARLNAAALVDLMLKYNFLIPARSFPLWRPTKRDTGDIAGVREAVEIVATDGLLGWFITFEGDPWLGHIHHFSGKVEPLHSAGFGGQMTKKPKKLRQKSKRQMIIDSL